MIDPQHVITLNGKSYPLFAGILAEAHERGLQSIETTLVQVPTADNEHTAIMKATVTMKDGSTFTDYADASPRNTSARVATALLRLASTRAKGRALRDAVNVGDTMLEELPDIEEERHAGSGSRAPSGRTAGSAGSARTTGSPSAPPAEARDGAGAEMFTAPNGKAYTRAGLIEAVQKYSARASALKVPSPAGLPDNPTLSELWEHGKHLVEAIHAAEQLQEVAAA